MTVLFFTFIPLNILSHHLLASIVSEEKLAVNCTGVHLYIMSHFSLIDVKIFGFQHFDYSGSECGYISIYPT